MTPHSAHGRHAPRSGSKKPSCCLSTPPIIRPRTSFRPPNNSGALLSVCGLSTSSRCGIVHTHFHTGRLGVVRWLHLFHLRHSHGPSIPLSTLSAHPSGYWAEHGLWGVNTHLPGQPACEVMLPGTMAAVKTSVEGGWCEAVKVGLGWNRC